LEGGILKPFYLGSLKIQHAANPLTVVKGLKQAVYLSKLDPRNDISGYRHHENCSQLFGKLEKAPALDRKKFIGQGHELLLMDPSRFRGGGLWNTGS
jgi:hypothetical protein